MRAHHEYDARCGAHSRTQGHRERPHLGDTVRAR